MLDFLNRWRLREDSPDEDAQSLPWPVTQQGPPSASSVQLDISAISPPIPRSGTSSLTGFSDEHVTHWQHYRQPSPIRRPGVGPRVRVPSEERDDEETTVQVPPPAAVRVDGGSIPRPSVVPHGHVHPMGRSDSSPPSTGSLRSPSPSPSTESTATATSNTTTKMKLKLQPPEVFSQSTHSLRLDSQAQTVNTDMYGNSYNYPLAKQLSPIAEQDYVSPNSTRQSTGLPSREGSQNNLSRSTSAGSGSPASALRVSANASPDGSQGSEITRPSPSYSSPFITRQLNRTTSQTSSRTHVSTTSTAVTRPPPGTTTKSSEPPSIPPLDLRPPFPGPHPSQNGSGPPLRPRRSTISAMPVIAGSAEGYYDEEEYGGSVDHESLHADSFVTATSKDRVPGGSSRRIGHEEEEEEDDDDDDDDEKGESMYGHRKNPSLPSIRSIRSQAQSTNESFIARRWDRDAALGSGGVPTFRAKRQWITVTPAFWAFWLGFICPVLWLVGGWHFTNFGEQPPRLTFWEFYFNAGYWKEKFCGGRNKKRDLMLMNTNMGMGMGMSGGAKEGTSGEGNGNGNGKTAVFPPGPPLPRWVAEKQASEDGRARLNDPKRSLRGISFGYPFISRPVQCSERRSGRSWFARTFKAAVAKPNRVFDHLLYGVKLKEVRGRPESGRRMFDPWIQRCRYALCYAGVLLAIGLITVSTYLIVFNTRNLR